MTGQIIAPSSLLIRKRRDVRKMKGKPQVKTIFRTTHRRRPRRSRISRQTLYSNNRIYCIPYNSQQTKLMEARASRVRQMLRRYQNRHQARPCRNNRLCYTQIVRQRIGLRSRIKTLMHRTLE